jgi:eukaryotic-like serine/threonine-protein kinase
VNRSDYARLKDIVAGALARPATDRASYVTGLCGPDGGTRIEVESLLAAALQAADLFEEPTLLVDGARVTLDALEHVDGVALPLTPPTLFAQPSAELADDFAGTARYAVRRRIGAGGMGVVYEVEDRDRGQVVALKSLRRRSADDIYQLKREFRNLADAAHPNLVSLYDLVVEDGLCFFTMELVEGLTFVDYVRQSSPAALRVDRIRQGLPQLVAAVEELHRRGLQHRDIKPSNVLATPAGRVVVLDFGLTSSLLREGANGGDITGTPAYLSPEQCRGGPISNACDWYSVGATLYHALTGSVPFDGPIRELIARKAAEDPPPVSALAPDTPADLHHACMGLLRRDPAERLSGRQALELLSPQRDARSTTDATPDDVFVGRESSLSLLEAAFADVASGRSVSVVVHGPSGIGKSALVQRFLDRQLEGRPVLVLRSRCHEHESIPYKGLDGVIDSITRHLATLPAADVARMLPSGAPALARLFPVLRALNVGPLPEEPVRDPLQLRRDALAALRELLTRLAGLQPVIVDIDDFHWADADSIRWLTELLHPPGPPRLLTLIAFRSEELEAKPFLRSLMERVDLGARVTIPLGPLSQDEIARLIDAVGPGSPDSVASRLPDIARGSGGNPFLVDALARTGSLGARPAGQSSVDEVVARRLETLPRESRIFLETLAVCGRPMLPARVFEACGLGGDERPLVARLRAVNLVRNSRTTDRVEVYHDRIRESVAASVSAEAARAIHDVMARVLVAHGDDDPEALFEHYRAAGHTAAAAAQAAAAAAKASVVLAFDLAATFFRHALELQPEAGPGGSWRAGLAHALENAGRPVEAAETYLVAADQASPGEQLEWRRKAAELLLVGGRIDQGLQVIEDVLRRVGVRLARGPRTALASLVLRRLQLRWRGFDLDAAATSAIAREDLLRIDACWSLTVGMAMVDPLRAADFNVRQLLWALQVADRDRVARALALEGGFSVIVPVGTEGRPADLFHRAEALASSDGRHYVGALASLWAGIGAFLTGQWVQASSLCGRAVTILRDHCTGVTWELNLAQNFYLFSLVYRGELREAAGHLPGLLASARERGNFYLELELGTRLGLVWLAADNPNEAERRANDGIARWVQQGFQRPHYHHLLTLLQVRLYRAEANDAWTLLERHEALLRQSHFRRVQHTRVEVATYRARCALARAGAGHAPAHMRQLAAAQARRILGEKMPWATPFARLIQATVAYQEGRPGSAIEGLADAVDGFRGADMHLHATVCQRRLGALVGGDRGLRLRVDADHWMATQEIRNPTAIARLIAPGFPD